MSLPTYHRTPSKYFLKNDPSPLSDTPNSEGRTNGAILVYPNSNFLTRELRNFRVVKQPPQLHTVYQKINCNHGLYQNV
ncbi:hypothetical protein CC2G_003285 [Coprinopsis cinerea AmutBmut pab1-1]|nr:hypothetical protein CC2G_003285 [Coprinopsis cinerea AmutBmut pab1-1]